MTDPGLLVDRRSSRPVMSVRARTWRLVATTVVVVLGLVAAPVAMASATEHDEPPEPVPPATSSVEARGIDRVCPPPDDRGLDLAEPIEFPDIGTTHAGTIACASAYRLLSGFEDGTVRPGVAVTRAQTASVVRGWLELATGFELTVPAEQPFEDVSGTHADAIAALAAVQVISGRADGTFGPDEPLTRGQFSQVMSDAISYADLFRIDGPLPAAPEPDTVSFTDIAGSTFEDDILALAAARITTGTADGAFSPSEAVTRGQLATFLMRGADYLDRHQRWRPTVKTFVLVAELTSDDAAVPPADPDPSQDDGTSEPGVGLAPRASITLVVNAFNGTLTYVADLSDTPSLQDPDARLWIRLGAVDGDGAVVLELADGATLGAEESGMLSGTLVEVDSALRFADLIAAPEAAFVELVANDLPGGRMRGSLNAGG